MNLFRLAGELGDLSKSTEALQRTKEQLRAAQQALPALWAEEDRIRERIRASGHEPADDRRERVQEVEQVKNKLREVNRKLRIEHKRFDRAGGVLRPTDEYKYK